MFTSEKFENVPTNAIATVDVIVPRIRPVLGGWQGEILLYERHEQPFSGQLALPGGRINYADMSLEDAAIRVVKNKTGLDISNLDLRYIQSYGTFSRDPRPGRWISTLMGTPILIDTDDLRVASGMPPASLQYKPMAFSPELREAEWVAIPDIAQQIMAFDHKAMIENALDLNFKISHVIKAIAEMISSYASTK